MTWPPCLLDSGYWCSLFSHIWVCLTIFRSKAAYTDAPPPPNIHHDHEATPLSNTRCFYLFSYAAVSPSHFQMCTCSFKTSTTVFATSAYLGEAAVKSKSFFCGSCPLLSGKTHYIYELQLHFFTFSLLYYDYVIMIADVALILWLDRNNTVHLWWCLHTVTLSFGYNFTLHRCWSWLHNLIKYRKQTSGTTNC